VSIFILLSKKKIMLFNTVNENCMCVEFEIGLGTTREPEKRNSYGSNLKKASLKAKSIQFLFVKCPYLRLRRQ
jgi:hypothetical protein